MMDIDALEQYLQRNPNLVAGVPGRILRLH
jgi:hypothetical protein